MDTRPCRTCRISKPISEFNVDRHIRDGLSTQCKGCQATRWANKPGRKRTGRKPYVEPSDKFCSGCQTTHPIGDFSFRTDRQNGRLSRCCRCVSVAHQEWRERNPLASRLRNLKSKYGLTGDQYMEILANQDGHCAICPRVDSGWATSPFLHVDHDHVTGEVRGLLCHPCNIAVGLVENGVPIDSLLTYLS